MKKLKETTIQVEVPYCNICGKEIGDQRVYNTERMALVSGIVKTATFDAHEKCVNKVIRTAFAPYAEIRTVRSKEE